MRLYTFLIVFLLGLGVAARAQQTNRSDLEKRRASLLNDIANTQSQLEETKKDKKATLGQLKGLMAKLESRQQLINNINSGLDKINGNISTSTSEIETLKQNLASLKMAYAQSIRYAYKHRVNQNMLAFLFSAQDFNDAMRRMQYLRKYRDYRKEQVEKIRASQERLTSQINVLNSQRNEKGKLLAVEEVQKNQIQGETQETNKVVTELKGREKELVGQIQANQRTARKLEASIKEQIRKEIEIAQKRAAEEARKRAAEEALARKRAEEDARRKAELAKAQQSGGQDVVLNTGSSSRNNNNTNNSNSTTNSSKPIAANTTAPTHTATVASKPATKAPSKNYTLSLTPEVQNLSDGFAANKGKLPWPVEKGFISTQFGRHPHAVFTNIIVESSGIDITTGEGAPVRAVFGGTVSKVMDIEGTMIMVSHGEYYTIYTNLSGANVKVGDKVSARQVIGHAGKNDEGENIVNFQIWKAIGNSSKALNPTEWIAR